MYEVIEFKTKTNNLYKKKYTRKVELCVKKFNQNITDNEELELDKLCQWLEIHS
jgi:hypothetical protein